ncbi:CotH kinase family protein [Bacteroides fragilis]
MPVLFIETEDGSAISSKNEYKNATICIWGDSLPLNSDVKIKGRGNSTWTLPKKPYKLKFPEKVSLLGAPKDKEWVLLANYADKTNLRNETAFYMGRISQLEWTPRTHFVEVFINDVYEGTYQLCEQVKVSTSRVDVTDDGFLLEIDHLDKLDATDTYFETERILVNIKKPNVEVGDEKYCFIKEYITEAERVLFGDNFKDPVNGYRKYLDVNSFVDWYLVNEIAKNNDAVFWSSCYMNVSPNGKIKMGPLWDFDIAFGNINYNNNQLATGFWVKEASWIKRLFEDTYFVDKVKERFKYFMERKEDIFMYINKTADTLHYSAIENNNRWGTLYSNTWPNYAVWGAYENEVQYMKFWLDKRFLWLDKAFEDE